VQGPSPAGIPDIRIFRSDGLMDMIPPGKRVIGDNGYRGERDIISTPNSHESADLRKFKSRARARHESFNGRIKFFRCLSERFHHSIEKHGIAFEAICVIVQYQMENGSPLFDV
jgi:DDE superfamily endonuclease